MSEPVVSGRTHRSTMRKLLKGPGAKLGVFWIGLLFVVAVLSPFLANSAPLIEISESGLRFPVLASLAPADVVLLCLVALLPPVLYLPFSWRTVVPVAIGLVGMRLVEIFEAVPTLFLLLTFVAFFDRSLYLMMVIIGLTSWTPPEQ